MDAGIGIRTLLNNARRCADRQVSNSRLGKAFQAASKSHAAAQLVSLRALSIFIGQTSKMRGLGAQLARFTWRRKGKIMARIQQSIQVQVPVQVLYNQLTQFEDYPRFMGDVETVEQLDDTRLRWTAMMGERPVVWNAEITEQTPDRCIVWQSMGEPYEISKLEVQPVGPDSAQVTFTLDADPGQPVTLAAGDSEAEMAQRLREDLERLKFFIEGRGSETGSWRGEIHDTQVTLRGRDAAGRDAVRRDAAQHEASGDLSGSRGGASLRNARDTTGGSSSPLGDISGDGGATSGKDKA